MVYMIRRFLHVNNEVNLATSLVPLAYGRGGGCSLIGAVNPEGGLGGLGATGGKHVNVYKTSFLNVKHEVNLPAKNMLMYTKRRFCTSKMR